MPKKKGRPTNPDRGVVMINCDTGETTAFRNYREASDSIGGNRGNVYLCLEGIRKSHMGYAFKYQDEC